MMMRSQIKQFWQTKRDISILFLCLLLGLAHGVVYVFLVLPWQHYDEPNHFEYAWLIAHHPGLPNEKSNDPALNKAVVQSMIKHRFFEIAGMPNPTYDDENLRMPFFSQKSDPPLYYILASIPLRVLKNQPIEHQLYGARLVSLGFFLLTIVFCWGAVKEITSDGHPLRWMVPMALVLLPGLVDIFSAVNNDAAGIAMFTLFLWGNLRWLRGRSWLNLIWLVLAAISCALARSTTLLALPFALIVIIFGSLSKPLRKYVWLLGLGVVLVGIIFGVRWGEPRNWYHQTSLDINAALESSQAMDGKRVFRISSQEGKSRLVQVLATEDTFQKPISSVTLAGWMWADQPVKVQTPKLHIRSSGIEYGADIELTTSPTFFTLSIEPEGSLYRSWVSLEVPSDENFMGSIYLDELILVEGEFQGNHVKIVDGDNRIVEWDSKRLRNFIRNGSAEELTIAPRQWLERVAGKVLPDKGFNSATLLLYSITDTEAMGKYYLGAFLQVFRTFWAKFGWGGTALVGGTPYRYLGYYSLLGAVGALWYGWRKRRELDWDVFGIMLVIVLVFGISTLTRGSNYILRERDFYPNARYLYPVILPIMVFLTSGWYWVIIEQLGRYIKPKWILVSVFVGIFIYLDILSVQAVYLVRMG